MLFCGNKGRDVIDTLYTQFSLCLHNALLLGYSIQMCTSQKADSARVVNQGKGEELRPSYSMRGIVFCLRTLHPCVRACENVVTDFKTC